MGPNTEIGPFYSSVICGVPIFPHAPPIPTNEFGGFLAGDLCKLLEVILDDGEPMRNVPRSLKEEGHQIVRVEKLENGKFYKLWIKKG